MIPSQCLAAILVKLDFASLARARLVNRLWRDVATSEWFKKQHLSERYPPDSPLAKLPVVPYYTMSFESRPLLVAMGREFVAIHLGSSVQVWSVADKRLVLRAPALGNPVVVDFNERGDLMVIEAEALSDEQTYYRVTRHHVRIYESAGDFAGPPRAYERMCGGTFLAKWIDARSLWTFEEFDIHPPIKYVPRWSRLPRTKNEIRVVRMDAFTFSELGPRYYSDEFEARDIEADIHVAGPDNLLLFIQRKPLQTLQSCELNVLTTVRYEDGDVSFLRIRLDRVLLEDCDIDTWKGCLASSHTLIPVDVDFDDAPIVLEANRLSLRYTKNDADLIAVLDENEILKFGASGSFASKRPAVYNPDYGNFIATIGERSVDLFVSPLYLKDPSGVKRKRH